MEINRRQFLALATAAAGSAVAGCPLLADSGGSEMIIDAGPVSGFSGEGVYSNFRELGFFVIRQEGKLFALSSVCTHRKVKVSAEHDCSFYCKRHGSTFDPGGHVTQGPAKRDLPVLATSVNGSGHLLVRVPPQSA
jgi:Rieske Fe-S protein